MLKRLSISLLLGIFLFLNNQVYVYAEELIFDSKPIWLKQMKGLLNHSNKRFIFAICNHEESQHNMYSINTVLYYDDRDLARNKNSKYIFQYNEVEKDFKLLSIFYDKQNDKDICDCVEPSKRYKIYIWSKNTKIKFNNKDFQIGVNYNIPEGNNNYTKYISKNKLDNIRLCHAYNNIIKLHPQTDNHIFFDQHGYGHIQYKEDDIKIQITDSRVAEFHPANTPQEQPDTANKVDSDSKTKTKGYTLAIRDEVKLGNDQTLKEEDFKKTEPSFLDKIIKHGYDKLKNKINDPSNLITKENSKSFFISNIDSKKRKIEYSPVYCDDSRCNFFVSSDKFDLSFLWEKGKEIAPIGQLGQLKKRSKNYVLEPFTLLSNIDDNRKKKKELLLGVINLYRKYDNLKKNYSKGESKYEEPIIQDLQKLYNRLSPYEDLINENLYPDPKGNIALLNNKWFFEKDKNKIWRFKNPNEVTVTKVSPNNQKIVDIYDSENDWGDKFTYAKAPILNKKGKFGYCIIKGDKKIFKINEIITENTNLSSLEQNIGTWLIVDDYLSQLDSEKERTKLFREFKSSKQFCELEKNITAYRTDIIRGTDIQLAKTSVCSNSSYPDPSEIESFLSLSDHKSSMRGYEWELHLFLLRNTSGLGRIDDELIKGITAKFQELKVRRLIVWEFCESIPADKETAYQNLFKQVVDEKSKDEKNKIDYKHIIVTSKENIDFYKKKSNEEQKQELKYIKDMQSIQAPYCTVSIPN